MSMPWFPIATVGTAVAFYEGFKNNQAYDRLRKARKIWGSIVNSSRSWATSVRGFAGYQEDEIKNKHHPTHAIHKKLIF